MQAAFKYLQQICFTWLYTYLSEDEGLFVVSWVQSIVHHHTCAEFLPNGVRRQPVHVNLNVCADFLV